MPSNRWVVLGLLFAVRVSTGIQYQAVASLSPELMSGFVLSLATFATWRRKTRSILRTDDSSC